MSVSYYFYLEAKLKKDNQWHCICPVFPVVKKPMLYDGDYSHTIPAKYGFAHIMWGGSSMWEFVEDVSDGRISWENISEELRNDLYTEKRQEEFEEKKDQHFYLPQFELIDSSSLLRISRHAEKKYDLAGYVSVQDAKIIDSEEVNENIYPAELSDVVRIVSGGLEGSKESASAESVSAIAASFFDKFYVYREWVSDFGTLYYEKELMKYINTVTSIFNGMCSYDEEISLDQCRVVIQVC